MKYCSQDLKSFSNKLRLRRHEMNMTQEQLAEAVDCHTNALGRLERGEAIPSFKMIINLARALKISPKDLLPEK